MEKNRFLILCLLVLLTACSPLKTLQPTSEPLQTTLEVNTVSTAVVQTLQAHPPTPVIATSIAGSVTAASIAIEREEGSGPVCTANATYFVHASITTDGPATAFYEISSIAGQIAAGNFEDVNNQTRSPTVTGRMIFTQADTKTINLRFVGPYPYPGDITVVLRVNGGEFHNAKLSCKGS